MTQMKLLSTNEAARMTGLTSRTISRWCRDGKISAHKLGRVWRIDEAVLRRFVYGLTEDD